MLFTIVTLFPKSFDSVFTQSIIGRAQTAKTPTIKTLDIRQFGIGKHRTVDDKPYGGGTGMVLRVDVLDAAIKAARIKGKKEAVILLEPKGEVYTQERAEFFSKFEHLILICGRYEGYDERIRELVDFEISIGDYVTSGGEIPAMVIVESVGRLVKGVIKKEEATDLESFSKKNGQRILEHPQYTRPSEYNGQKIPQELLSGDPKIVDEYRIKEAKRLTSKRRPDLTK